MTTRLRMTTPAALPTTGEPEKVYDARLEGWEGPHFTPALSSLQTAFQAEWFGKDAIALRGRQVNGFVSANTDEIRTSDGYEWCAVLDFVLENGAKVRILFPWRSSSSAHLLHRHCALYTQGPADMKRVGILIAALRTRFFE